MRSFSNRKLVILLLVLLVLSGLFLSITNPDKLPVAFLMVPVLLVFLIGTIVALLLQRAFGVAQGRQQRQRALAALFGTVAAFCLVFQSTGGIVIGDIILLALIVVVSSIYISRY